MPTLIHKKYAGATDAEPKLIISHSQAEKLEQYQDEIKSYYTLNAEDALGHWGEVHTKVGALAGYMAMHHSPKDSVEFMSNNVSNGVDDVLAGDGGTEPTSELDAGVFIQQHVVLNYEDGSLSYVGEQPADRDKTAVVQAIFAGYSNYVASDSEMRDIVLAAAGPQLSEDCARALIAEGEAQYVVNNLHDFEDVTFDQQAVNTMLGDVRTYDLPIKHYDLLDSSVDLQAVCDRVCRSYGPSVVVHNLINMPTEISVSDNAICRVARGGHVSVVLELLQMGRFSHLIGDHELRSAFSSFGMADEAYKLGFWADVTVDDYLAQLSSSRLSVLSLLEDPSKMRGLETMAGLERLLTEYTRLAGQPPYRHFLTYVDAPRYVQSAIFAQFVKGIAYEDLSAEVLSLFSNLSEDDYEIILEKYSKLFLCDPFTPECAEKLFSNASQGIRDRFEHEHRQAMLDALDQRTQKRQEVTAANERRKEQRQVELELYGEGAIVIEPLRPQKRPSLEHIYDGLEYDHCVKVAPRLQDQLRDRSRRHDMISYIGETRYAMGTATHYSEHAAKVRRTSELAALKAYVELLDRHDEVGSTEKGVSLSSLRDDITYIGKNEYKEAVRGIATYWKTLLDRDPKQQIFICTQAIGSEHFVKSDEYMIDRLVAQFSNEELERYKGRFTMNRSDIMESNPKDVRIVLVDDWTISGSQLRGAASEFIRRFPQFAGRIEIQLIAASRERISLGLEEITGKASESGGWAETELTMPVRAYYVAHAANSLDSSAKGACITGSHSSVDYGFENVLGRLIAGSNLTMPPIANIVRPYRADGYRRVYPTRMDVPDESPDESEGGEE